MVFEKQEDADAAYDAGRCDALHHRRLGPLFDPPEARRTRTTHIVLPEIISKEPLGPVVRQGDDQWFNIVKWVHYALLNAEELGVTQANVDADEVEPEPGHQAPSRRRRQLRRGHRPQQRLGGYNVIKAVGNYGEIFERNVGAGSQAADRARPERALVEGRHPVRSADPLVPS